MHACILAVMSAGVQTQQERSEGTRRLLLDTTIDCLAELGYAGTTGPAVAARAGLSRGAQLHHFGTRDQMVVAAVGRLAEQRLEEVREQMARRMGDLDPSHAADSTSDRATARVAMELLSGVMSGRLYGATVELWAAARTNEELRAELIPTEGRVRTELESICRTWISADPLVIRLTLDLLLGRGLGGMLVPPSPAAHRKLLDRWIDLVEAAKASA